MKELIEKLLKGDGRLSLLILEAKEYAENSNDKTFVEFINNELNGYTNNDFPEYRKIKAEIVGTVKDPYGLIVSRNQPIDFSILSNHLGFDLNTTYVPDGIGFIEDNLDGLDGQIIEKPLANEIVKMLNETFKYNNPILNLTSASHQFSRASVQFILTKVRQELIIGLRRINKESENGLNLITTLNKPEGQRTVFVTYCWENESHNDKVMSFVNFLRQKGYDATMDRKESQDQSATDFNQMMVSGIQNASKVIVILSKKYKKKADAFKGGVGFEYRLILEQLKSNNNKFIFISFGIDRNEDIVPTGIGRREILNLKKDQDETNFNQLFAKLESKDIISFSNVSETKVEVVTKKD